jgi:hypothetical protein
MAARIMPAVGPDGGEGWLIVHAVELGPEGVEAVRAVRGANAAEGLRPIDLEAVLQGVTVPRVVGEVPALRLAPRDLVAAGARALLDEGRVELDDEALRQRAIEARDAAGFARTVVAMGDFVNDELRDNATSVMMSLWYATPRPELSGRAPRDDQVPHSTEAAQNKVRALLESDARAGRVPMPAAGMTAEQVMELWQRLPHPDLQGRTPGAYLAETMMRQREREVRATPGRNQPCSCGSGKKYKLCCMPKAAPGAG